MAFGLWQATFDSSVKATQLAHDLCQVAHDEYFLLADAAGDAKAKDSAEILKNHLQPKFESACGAANKLIIDKLNDFINEQEAEGVKEHQRMSLGISSAVKAVHDKYIEPVTDTKTDDDLKQAEEKFTSDTQKLHMANYHAAHQAVRTEQASAQLDASTAAGSAAETLTKHKKQLQANERLKAGLLSKHNNLVMSILGPAGRGLQEINSLEIHLPLRPKFTVR